MPKLRWSTNEGDESLPGHTYVKLIRCPQCDRRLRASGGSERIPTFYCGRCHHTWNWLAHDARRTIIKKAHYTTPTHRMNGGGLLSRWRA